MKRLLIVLLVLLFVSCQETPDVEIGDLIPEPTPEVRTAVTSPSYTYFFPIIISDSRPTQQGLAKAYGAVTASDVDRLNIEWYYDYGLRYPSPVLGDAEYVPFFWCDQYPALKWPTQYNYFDSLAKLPDDYNGYLLFLNEPDLRGGDVDGWQCDRTPRQAAYIYKALLAECPNCIFVGPAASHIDYLQGWPWLREFYGTIYKMGLKPPQIAAAHDYTEQGGSELINSLFRLLDLFPGSTKKVWVTEFATCDPNLAKKSIEFYQSDERVERYAWFTGKGYPAAPCINLISGDTGLLQPVGDVYQQAYP